jgi:BirA family transcriptional regulator, biotin operon repressor / biotin---[acetyl-CoA-carboxylase] ligase
MTSERRTSWEGAATAAWRVRWRVPALEIFDRIGSTNDEARRLAEAGAAAGTTVIADEQSAGRGRYGRRWSAPAGVALLLSIILRPGPAPAGGRAPGTAPVRVALATARAIQRATGLRAGLKWPNDVIVPGAGKIAGILCEGSVGAADTGFVVAGIGINVGQTAADFPPELRETATSVARVTGVSADRAALAGALLDALRPFDLGGLGRLGHDELEEVARRDVLAGRIVQVGDAAGSAAGIADDAALLLRMPSGVHPVYHGSVRMADGSASAAP